MGRFHFSTHRVDGDNGNYSTAVDFFPRLKGKERYRTVGFKNLAMILGDVDNTYRKTTDLINHVRRQQVGGTPYRTLQANTEREGTGVMDYLEKKATSILRRHQFSEDGTYPGNKEDLSSAEPVTLPQETIQKAAAHLSRDYSPEELLSNPVPFEDPSQSLNITIDDVSVKKQSQERRRAPIPGHKKSKHQYVHDTVARVDKDKKKYSLVGAGTKATLRYLIALLLSNSLLGYRFQFFTDGHTTLNDTIRSCFEWYPNFGIILDWFHLVKKCKQLLSMALKGRLIRNDVLREVMPLLWHGFTDQAIEILEQVEPKKIKDDENRLKLTSYLERNKDMIPSYALRKQLGLKNSSAIGEKMNDLLVSSRQKHNGMSWSQKGSLALVALTAVKRNSETQSWLQERKLKLKLVA